MKNKTLDYTIVLIVFALTGISSVFVSGFIMDALGQEKWSLGYILGLIFITTPIYVVLLLSYAALFGKYRYFLEKQKKILRFIRRKF